MIIDVNVNLSRWPFRRLPHDDLPQFVAQLRNCGVTQAWTGSFDALLHQDVAAVNARLDETCRQQGDGRLLPVGTVNPTLPDWQEDIRRCDEVHRMHAIRVYPNYHNYRLDSVPCDELFRAASERRMIVQLTLKMEDTRTQHPLMPIANVDPAPLLHLIKRHPDLRLIVLNNSGIMNTSMSGELASRGHVYFDISHAEKIGALSKLLQDIPLNRLLFGSHFPFFVLDATLLKFRESPIGGLATRTIQIDNAQRLLDELGR